MLVGRRHRQQLDPSLKRHPVPYIVHYFWSELYGSFLHYIWNRCAIWRHRIGWPLWPLGCCSRWLVRYQIERHSLPTVDGQIDILIARYGDNSSPKMTHWFPYPVSCLGTRYDHDPRLGFISLTAYPNTNILAFCGTNPIQLMVAILAFFTHHVQTIRKYLKLTVKAQQSHL